MSEKLRRLRQKLSAHSIFSPPQEQQRPHLPDPSPQRLRSVSSPLRKNMPSGDSRSASALSSRADYASFISSTHIEDFQDRQRSRQIGTPSIERPADQYTDYHSSDSEADAPPDFTPRGIHIPLRTSSRSKVRLGARSRSRDPSSSISIETTPESRNELRSSAESVMSYATSISSIQPLPPLQNKTLPGDAEHLEPVLEDDPTLFDLVASNDERATPEFSLEKRAEQLFSKEHLEGIFADPALLLRFTSFLSAYRPNSVPILIYYLDALKALRAINYANAVAEALEPIPGYEFTEHPARPTVNSVLEDKARQAFEVLVKEDLPAYITHTFVSVVSLSIQRRITGTLAPHLREASEGLAEVFCLTDPSRPDNPIVFASEEFHRTTQYGVSYAIGRNCRFLQGPRTDAHAIQRLRDAVRAGREIHEVILNYRRDGSPFMNLLMVAPLFDSRGTLRYQLGAQVDISGLVRDGSDLEAFRRVLAKEAAQQGVTTTITTTTTDDDPDRDEFQALSEMFNTAELHTVQRHGGRMHREPPLNNSSSSPLLSPHPSLPRILLQDPPSPSPPKPPTIHPHYLLLRPSPSLRILFTSPTLRVPGILQSPFLPRIGGSARVRAELAAALAAGRGVTARIRWRTVVPQDEDADVDPGRPRWVHCTPLRGWRGEVGVWVVLLVDDEVAAAGGEGRVGMRRAPPVVGGAVEGRRRGSAGARDLLDAVREGREMVEGRRRTPTPLGFPTEAAGGSGGSVRGRGGRRTPTPSLGFALPEVRQGGMRSPLSLSTASGRDRRSRGSLESFGL